MKKFICISGSIIAVIATGLFGCYKAYNCGFRQGMREMENDV